MSGPQHGISEVDMNYPNGVEARLGDVVQLGESEVHRGVVVGSLDRNEGSRQFPAKDWSYLGRGILVNFDGLGLIHYREPEPTLVLVRRDQGTEA
jgi:hypothetical protein